MSKTNNEVNNHIPSSSPAKPKADSLGGFIAMSSAYEEDLLNTEEMAERIFSFLIDVPDKEVLSGTIKDVKDPELKPYVSALNTLFPLVKNSETGALRQLSPDVVKELSIKAYSKVAAVGGNPFVKFNCEVVNTEVVERIPQHHIVATSARPAFDLSHSHNSSISPAA